MQKNKKKYNQKTNSQKTLYLQSNKIKKKHDGKKKNQYKKRLANYKLILSIIFATLASSFKLIQKI